MSATSDGSRKTIPSAPTPVAAGANRWIDGRLAELAARLARASTMTKSFPDPLIL